MAEIYNLTGLDNSTNLLDLVTEINSISDGWLAGFTILTVWVILLLVFSGKNDFLDAMIGSSFITAIVAGLFTMTGFVNPTMLIFPLIALIASLFTKVVK